MNEIRKNPDGTYVTSCEASVDGYEIEGRLATLKDKIDVWLEEYGRDAILSIYYSDDTYEFQGVGIKYWRPSKKSEINRYEKELEEKRKEEERRTKRILEEKLRLEKNEKKKYERFKKKYEKS
jgi:hypothetical protein